MYALRKALLLERPSSFQREYTKSVQDKRSHMPVWEQNVLKRKSFILMDSTDAEVKGDHASGIQAVHKNMKGNSADGKDKVQFKRKRPKAPNPLSCKKKKKMPLVSKNNVGPVSVKESSNTGTNKRSRSKKRKRSNTAEEKTAQ